MSHLTKLAVKCLQKNEKELIEALEKHFGKDSVSCHDNAVELQGYEKLTAGKSRHAHLVVAHDTLRKVERRNGYNDLGFERISDGGYNLHYDTDDLRPETMGAILQDMAERVVNKTVRMQGYSITSRSITQDGEVSLALEKCY